jgi:hypothetical protein
VPWRGPVEIKIRLRQVQIVAFEWLKCSCAFDASLAIIFALFLLSLNDNSIMNFIDHGSAVPCVKRAIRLRQFMLRWRDTIMRRNVPDVQRIELLTSAKDEYYQEVLSVRFVTT